MAKEIITPQDLENFGNDLILRISEIVTEKKNPASKKWLRSSEVCAKLSISKSSLQTLRNKDLIPFTKLNGTFFYDPVEIDLLLEKG